MNKTHVIEHFRFALEAQLQNAKAAAKATMMQQLMKKVLLKPNTIPWV